MATMPTEPRPETQHACGAPLETALRMIEARLPAPADNTAELSDFGALGDDLRRLHRQLRVHQTEGLRCGSGNACGGAPPELAETRQRLIGERLQILGDLDRLIRTSEFVTDASIEDRDVFILRVKELVAILRRHQAEEERLFFQSVWRDTGGES